MRQPIVFFGGHGGAEVAVQVLSAINADGGRLRLHGYLNDVLPIGHELLLGRVLGSFASWVELPADVRFVAPLHKVGAMATIVSRVAGLGIDDDRWAALVDPTAAIAPNVEIGPGTVICAHSSVQPGAKLGRHVAVRHGALIAHDCNVGDFSFVGANAAVLGRCVLGEGAFVAAQSAVREDLRVGPFATVGLGAVVVDHVEDGEVVVGNPARPLRRPDPGGTGPAPGG